MLYLLLTWFYCNGNDLNTLQHVGAWRSLVAYLNGVQRAGGSNPLAPTIFIFIFTSRISTGLSVYFLNSDHFSCIKIYNQLHELAKNTI